MTESRSFNGKLILEAYKHAEVRAEIKSGWASVSQKSSLKGLKLLIPAALPDGSVAPVGSTVYIKEELLHSQPWSKAKFKCDTLPGEFIVCTLNEVEYISPPEGTVA